MSYGLIVPANTNLDVLDEAGISYLIWNAEDCFLGRTEKMELDFVCSMDRQDARDLLNL